MKVSVIVPIYNGERFVNQLVKAINEQTHNDLEIILVNDGSTDKSWELIQQNASKDSDPGRKIIALNQQNSGISAARNSGLEIATGEWIMFMDQDDHIYADCVESLLNEAVAHSADMIIGGVDIIDETGRLIEKWTLKPSYPWCKFRIIAPWGRLFRRDVIEDNHIRFRVATLGEDFYFNHVYMSFCDNVCVSEYIGYAWVIRKESTSHHNTGQVNNFRKPLDMLTSTVSDVKDENILKDDYFIYSVMKKALWYPMDVAGSADSDELKIICRESESWLDSYFPLWRQNPQIGIFKPKGESFKVRMILAISVWLSKHGWFYDALRLYAAISR